MPRDDEWIMGALAAQDQYRPLGNDPWTNTMRGTAPAPGQGFAVSADPVLYPTASPLVNITEGDIKRATEVGLAASGGGIKGQQIKAYHSSPHDFDKFDLSRIGTGEGAQVYGHGLYFAENPAVSGQGGQYWKAFADRFREGPEGEAVNYLKVHGGNRQKALGELEKDIAWHDWNLKNGTHTHTEEVIPVLNQMKQARDLLSSDKPVGPRTYEVNIKADPAHMLDWDKPLREQAHLLDQLQSAGVSRSLLNEASGGDLYHKAAIDFHRPGLGHLDRALASEKLAEAGIPGIRYLDQGSRMPPPDIIEKINAKQQAMALLARTPEKRAAYQAEIDALKASIPQGTSNYVIFDPSIIDIVKKYGLAGAAPAGMGALAAQDAYRSE